MICRRVTTWSAPARTDSLLRFRTTWSAATADTADPHPSGAWPLPCAAAFRRCRTTRCTRSTRTSRPPGSPGILQAKRQKGISISYFATDSLILLLLFLREERFCATPAVGRVSGKKKKTFRKNLEIQQRTRDLSIFLW